MNHKNLNNSTNKHKFIKRIRSLVKHCSRTNQKLTCGHPSDITRSGFEGNKGQELAKKIVCGAPVLDSWTDKSTTKQKSGKTFRLGHIFRAPVQWQIQGQNPAMAPIQFGYILGPPLMKK